MVSVSRKDVDALLGQQGPCVSILFPTHRSGREIQQAKIRLKNSLRDAGSQLEALEVAEDEIHAILAPGRKLLEAEEPWHHLEDSLAVYLSPNFALHLTLAGSIDPILVVGQSFYVLPLVALLEESSDFYILALSQNQVRLLRADRYSAAQMSLGSIPASLTEVVGEDWKPTSLQLHGGGSTGSGTTFHGHGGHAQESKKEMERFCHAIDTGLHARLTNSEWPLVVAAVDPVDSIFRHTTHYPRVIEEGLTGNAEHTSVEELHERAWPLVERQLAAALEARLASCRALLGTGKASTDIREILPAAADGRVDALFIGAAARRWGRFDPHERLVELTGEEPQSEELLNRAALLTKMAGGSVQTVDPAAMPAEATAAAVFRY